jgi:hypothetical protein
MYQTAAVLQSVDQHTVLILSLCALALVGNYIFWIETLRLGFKHKTYSMPVACLMFFLPHDATFVAQYHHWFHDVHHWFPELWCYGLCVTVCMELAFLALLLKHGRAELAPNTSQAAFTALVCLGLAMCTIVWLVLKSAMQDELFLVIFGITIFWCAPFNLALMARRNAATGQSQLAWIGFLIMPVFYYPATFILSPGFLNPLWAALGAVTIIGGLMNLIFLRHLNRQKMSALHQGTTPHDRPHFQAAAATR